MSDGEGLGRRYDVGFSAAQEPHQAHQRAYKRSPASVTLDAGLADSVLGLLAFAPSFGWCGKRDRLSIVAHQFGDGWQPLHRQGVVRECGLMMET
jgi:hypothetical protein